MRGWMSERRLSSTDAPDNHVSLGVDAFFMTLPAGHIIDSIISRDYVASAMCECFSRNMNFNNKVKIIALLVRHVCFNFYKG